MRNSTSALIVLPIVIIALVSIILTTNFSSSSFGQKETNATAGGFDHIKKFDSNGKLITSWGSTGSGDGQFLHAHGIGLDSAGNVYVSDAENYNIQKFDSNGKFITKWGSRGSGDGQFLTPESIDVDSNGNVFVVDFKNANIQKFDSNGKFITKWGSKGTG
jgi:tripartite motif-containing protein 71